MTFEWLRASAVFGSLPFAGIGVLVFWLGFLVLDKLTPYRLLEELVEKPNVVLGISVIVAAAMHG